MAKIRSFGAKLYLNGIAVGGLTDIAATGTEVSIIDTTSHDSSGGYRTFLSGLKDGGTLEVTGRYNYADAGQAEWKAEAGVLHAFYIILADNSGLAFNAIVGGFQTSNPLDDAVEFTATAKITGLVYPVFPTITVTGTLTSNGSTPLTFPALIFAGVSASDRIIYTETGLQSSPDYYAEWSGSSWTLGGSTALFVSTSVTLTPDQATWTASAQSPATGTPTLTGS